MQPDIKKVAQQKDAPAMAGHDLSLLSGPGMEPGYAIVEGLVRNLLGQSLQNVEVVVTIYDKDSEFMARTMP